MSSSMSTLWVSHLSLPPPILTHPTHTMDWPSDCHRIEPRLAESVTGAGSERHLHRSHESSRTPSCPAPLEITYHNITSPGRQKVHGYDIYRMNGGETRRLITPSGCVDSAHIGPMHILCISYAYPMHILCYACSRRSAL